MLKGHKETENSKSTQKVRENRKPRKPGLEKPKNNTRVTMIFFFYVKLNLHLKFIILIKTQANVLF